MFDQLKTVLELTNLEIQKISKPDNQKLQSMMKKSTNPFMSVKFLGDTPAVLSLENSANLREEQWSETTTH